MLNPKKFYGELWKRKQSGEIKPLQNRDWFHKFVLDRIFNPLENPRHEIALQLLNPGKRILDVGCWDGHLLDLIQSAGLYQELHGVDIPSEAIEKVKSKGYFGRVVDLNGEPLPFPDSYFDSVTLLAVLEHVFDPYILVREIYRVLRPGGQFVIDVPNVSSFTNRIRILFGRLPITSSDPGWDGGHLHYFTKHALDKFLSSEGFEILKRKATGGHPQLREWWLSLLAGEFIYLCCKPTK
jgi:methionine biosynthesis protein MetW